MKQRLIKDAKQARDLAYAPYSHFKVGAAVLSQSDTIFTGCNIENSSYSLTCCAERVAIFKALSSGEKKFKGLAVVADTEQPVSPCGACRQVMSEFFHPKTTVYLANLQGQIKTVTMNELLPFSFTLK